MGGEGKKQASEVQTLAPQVQQLPPQVQQLSGPLQHHFNIEKEIRKAIGKLSTKIRKFSNTQRFGARKIVYQVPAKVSANAVDNQRLKLRNKGSQVHKTAEELQKLTVRLNREVQEAQASEYVLQLLKARLQECELDSATAKAARAKASAEAQARAVKAATVAPLSIDQVRSAGNDQGLVLPPDSDDEVDIR